MAPVARVAVAADAGVADALGRDVVEVEDARLRLAPEHADDAAVEREVEAERLQDQAERLPDGDVLQLADERAADRGSGTTLRSCRARAAAADR